MAGNCSDRTHTLVSRRQKKKAKKLATVIQNRKQHALRAIYKIEN